MNEAPDGNPTVKEDVEEESSSSNNLDAASSSGDEDEEGDEEEEGGLHDAANEEGELSDQDMEDRENEEEIAAPRGLSKSWAVRSAHVPIYTGGTMALLNIPNDDGGVDTPLLCTLVNGDVCLSSLTGVKFCSLRGKNEVTGNAEDSDEDEDDEGFDVDSITTFVVLSTGARVLTCSFNSVIRQYTILRCTETKYNARLDGVIGKAGHTLPVVAMIIHGAFLATGSVDGSVRIFDTRQKQLAPTHVFRYASKVTGMKWYPGSLNQLVLGIGRADGSIAIHDLQSSQHRRKDKKIKQHGVPNVLLKDHDSAVTSLVWDITRGLFYSSGRDSVINLWKIVEGKNTKYKKLQTLPVYERVEGMELVTSSDTDKNRTFLLSAGSHGRLRLWEAVATADTFRLKEAAKQLEKDVFGEDRGGYLGMIQHNYDDGMLVADAEHNISIVKVARSLSKGNDEKEVLAVQTQETIVGHNDEILDVHMVPGSNDIAVVTNSHLVRLFDRDTFRCRILDACHTATLLCVDASPCGRYLATCGKDNTIRIWHVATGHCVAAAVGHTEAVGSTALSRKLGKYQVSGKAAQNSGGSFCVSVSVDRTLKRWNLPGDDALMHAAETGKEIALKAIASTRAHEKDINIVSIAPNDSLLATGSQDKTIAVWKATDLSRVALLQGHRRGVWDCQFSPYDKVLASSSGDKTIKLWSLSDFSCVRTFHGHSASVLRVRYLCGGLQLVSSGADGLLKLWTVRTNECEATMDSHTGKIWGMDVCDDGNLLFTGGADSRLVCWKDTTAVLQAEKLAEREEEILLNQKLMNHIRRREFKEALKVSLERDKPHSSLKILNEILNAEAASREPLSSLKPFLREQPLTMIVRLLRYCREWNVRSKTSHVALSMVKMIVSTISIERLVAEDEVPEIIAGMIPYIERHFQRLDRLHTSCYLVDFVALNMGIMDMDEDDENLFTKWEATSEFKPLTGSAMDGRVDIGGNVVIGKVATQDTAESDAVVTIGESDSDDDSL